MVTIQLPDLLYQELETIAKAKQSDPVAMITSWVSIVQFLYVGLIDIFSASYAHLPSSSLRPMSLFSVSCRNVTSQ
jgi:hypothetical protein